MEANSVNEMIPVFPGFIIIIVLFVGIGLAFWKPFKGYLFSIIVPILLAIPTMTFTRFERTGPYFNLYDACFLVLLIAIAIETERSRIGIRLPLIALIILGVLILGFTITTWRYGFSYETLRALRWGINLPVYMIGGYIMMRGRERDTALFSTLLLGAFLAEAQHVFLVIANPTLRMGGPLGQLRTSMFQLARSESWLLAGPYLVNRAFKAIGIQVVVGVLFLVAVVTTQTRTLALGLIGGFALTWVLLIRSDQMRSKRYLVMGAVIVGIVVGLAIPRLQIGSVLDSFAERLLNIQKDGLVDSSAMTRREALSIELSDWLDGSLSTILMGNGLDYFTQKYNLGRGPSGEAIAFGHLGYVTYLSQLGLLGFAIYAVVLPFIVIKRAISIVKKSSSPVTKHLAILAGASFLFSIVAFVFSGHFLMTDILSGTLAGFVLSGNIAPRFFRREGRLS